MSEQRERIRRPVWHDLTMGTFWTFAAAFAWIAAPTPRPLLSLVATASLGLLGIYLLSRQTIYPVLSRAVSYAR